MGDRKICEVIEAVLVVIVTDVDAAVCPDSGECSWEGGADADVVDGVCNGVLAVAVKGKVAGHVLVVLH